MRNLLTCIGAAALLSTPLVTLGQPSPEDTFFDGRELEATPEERTVLRVLETNRPTGKASSKPVVGTDGSARFVFGASLPIVVCAPLQLCDIELEPGESVQSLQIGDQSRWSVEPAIAGVGPLQVQHVVVRPSDVGIRTSLVVTTDRRTYRMQLVADRKRYMTSVSFSYPQQVGAAFKRLSKPRRREHSEPGGEKIARSGASLKTEDFSVDSLSFSYELEGDSPAWKPVRVYNDGLRTIIEMPFSMRQTEAPALLVVRSEGGLFTDDEVVQVNFRIHGTKYVVDTVFDIADLVTGVGSTQQKVRIRRTR